MAMKKKCASAKDFAKSGWFGAKVPLMKRKK
jgi:hypothetical protein